MEEAMGLRVTITIESDSIESQWSMTNWVDLGGDNPKYHATTAEQGIVQAARPLIGKIVRMDGDIRDDTKNLIGFLSERDQARPITGASS
jgi:hypothetical protein